MLKLFKFYAHVDSYNPNASKVSILVILEVKEKELARTNWKKVCTNKCDIDEQPEIEYAHQNRKYLYLRKYDR